MLENFNGIIKIKILMAGILVTISGVCIGSAVSWFAGSVLFDYNNPSTTMDLRLWTIIIHRDYGSCLFMGKLH